MGELTRDDVGVAVAAHPDGAVVALRVVPRAPSTRLAGRHGARLKLRVGAPPVDGAANQEVCAFLADRCRVRRTDVALLRGDKSRDKAVLIRGLARDAVISALLDR